MNGSRIDCLLYAVTDRSWLNGDTLANQVKEAIAGGVTMVQLREKNTTKEEFLELATELRAVTKEADVPLLINDNVEIALACDADGVHVGQKDQDACEVRKLIGKDKVLGVSVQTVEQAFAAEENGADYLGVGAVFGTLTKADADTVSTEILHKICSAVSIPVVAIGGISKTNLSQLRHTGIAGVAVVSAIFAQENKKKAARDLMKELREWK